MAAPCDICEAKGGRRHVRQVDLRVIHFLGILKAFVYSQAVVALHPVWIRSGWSLLLEHEAEGEGGRVREGRLVIVACFIFLDSQPSACFGLNCLAALFSVARSVLQAG